MKLKQWLYGATALAMLAACSDKDIAPGGGELVDESELSSGVDGYLAVEIKLPEEAVTRAENDPEDEGAKNDVFDDGEKAEYAVKNAMLVIFKGGSNEKDATFYKAYNLEKPFFSSMPEDDQITSTYIAAVPVEKLATNNTEHYYGLAIINRDGSTTDVPSGQNGSNTGVKIGGKTLSETTTFSNVLSYITTATNSTDPEFLNTNGFFMTNAPLAEKPGSVSSSAADIHYLADLGTKTYTTISEAKNAVKSCIYVERAVAKVTSGLDQNATGFMTFVDKDGKPIEGIKVTATVTYALTNKNKKSYVVRNIESSNLGDHFSWNLASTIHTTPRYRMIGTTPMPGLSNPFHEGSDMTIDGETLKAVSLYRTYWCHDPNYNKNMYKDGDAPAEGETSTAENTTGDEMFICAETDLKAISTNLYCRENTFDVKHQNNGNSTMVVYKIAFSVSKSGVYTDGSLYIKDGDNKKIYVSAKDACWDEITRIINDKDIQTALTEAIKLSPSIKDYADENGVVKNAEQYLDFDIAADDDKNLLVNSIQIKEGSGITSEGIIKFNQLIGTPDGTDGTTEEAKGSQVQVNLLARVNGLSNITEYTGGVSYYSIPVKHFGDYYCPWTEVIGTTTKDVYNNKKDFGSTDNHAKDFLGRYGMVRNNWYDLKINKIEALGSPTFPEINVTLSDDNKEEKRYIGVEIHVLSWAKRTQNVEF